MSKIYKVAHERRSEISIVIHQDVEKRLLQNPNLNFTL